MKKLDNLSPAPGSHRDRKRLGRGIGSGLGKTAGKGHKGQRARKSGGIRPGFEGGQTPLFRRSPKVGFTNADFKKTYNILKLSDLARFPAGSVVTEETVREAGLLKSKGCPVKILGSGAIDRKLTVRGIKMTEGAKKALVAAGGTIEEAR